MYSMMEDSGVERILRDRKILYTRNGDICHVMYYKQYLIENPRNAQKLHSSGQRC